MTSFAFILGVVPLVLADGAGAEMRRSLGTAVFSGMLGVTLFGIFLTPVFFYVIEWLGETPAVRDAWPCSWIGSAAGRRPGRAGASACCSGRPAFRHRALVRWSIGVVLAIAAAAGRAES